MDPDPDPSPAPAARPDRTDACVLAGLLLLTVAFLSPYLFLRRSMLPLELLAVFQPWASHPGVFGGEVPLAHNPLLDTLQQYFPRRVYMTDALRAGWLPLWNPYVYGGSPFLAAQQGAVLYPPAWLLTLFPPALQFGWSALLHLYAAAAGMYLFLRRLGLRPAAGAVGGIAFAFNGFIVVWLAYPNVTQWTFCWLPLALYCWERGFHTRDFRWAAGSGAVLALNLLGGHGQSSAYALLVWGAWAAARCLAQRGCPISRLRQLVGWGGGPLLLGIGLSLGHLLPVLEYVPQTDRGARVPWESVVQAGMPYPQFWTFFLPRLFGDGTLDFAQQFWLPAGGRAGFSFVERTFYPGVAVLALAAPGLLYLRKREEQPLRVLAWVGVLLAVLGILWALATPLYWPLWRLLPGFGQFTAVARILCVTGWALAVLAALGTQALVSGACRGAFRGLAAGAAVAAVVTLTGHFLFGGWDPNQVSPFLAQQGRPELDALALRDLILALACVAGVAVLGFLLAGRKEPPRRPAPLALGLAALVAADLFAFGFGFNPRSDPGLLNARTPELQALRERTEPERFLSPRPADTSRDLKERMPSNLPSVFGAADILGSDSFVPLRYRDWEQATQASSGGSTSAAWARTPNVRAAAVSLYLAGERQNLKGLHPVVGVLTEDLRALPYARVHTHVQALSSKEELLQALSHPQRVNTVALTLGEGAPTYQGPVRIQPFNTRRLSGNRLSIEGNTPLPGLLVVAEAFDPGWKALVDGRPVQPTPVDHLLTGIPLEAGQHRVELAYAPNSFRAGLFGSLAALACLAGLLVPRRRRVNM